MRTKIKENFENLNRVPVTVYADLGEIVSNCIELLEEDANFKEVSSESICGNVDSELYDADIEEIIGLDVLEDAVFSAVYKYLVKYAKDQGYMY